MVELLLAVLLVIGMIIYYITPILAVWVYRHDDKMARIEKNLDNIKPSTVRQVKTLIRYMEEKQFDKQDIACYLRKYKDQLDKCLTDKDLLKFYRLSMNSLMYENTVDSYFFFLNEWLCKLKDLNTIGLRDKSLIGDSYCICKTYDRNDIADSIFVFCEELAQQSPKYIKLVTTLKNVEPIN